ncbi:hypothetical protein LR004_00795 [Candidatus Gracilibacteria bacterium]|nr:hypothetical protein [Candidatus Gracilibacteria bacterium]
MRIFANYSEKYVSINAKLINIYSKIDSRSFQKQTEFYKLFKDIISQKKIKTTDVNKLELITYIEDSLDAKYTTYKSLNQKVIKERNKIKKHTTLILKFSKKGNHDLVINKYKENIKSNGSVFLFKKSGDLTQTDIKSITNKITALNKDILIFIDQEGGWINRYVDYGSKDDVEKLFTSSEIDKKIRTIFPYNSGYYPSMEKIGKHYDTFTTDEEKITFLNKIAHIRLQGLKDNGINTYGLVLDLNRGNPVITNYSRSFSKHKDKYKKLVDAFTIASQKTGVRLYFKHFPGHGEGNIDSHLGILNLIGFDNYIQENIELFEYALDKNSNSGLMIGHMYIPNSKKDYFISTVNKANYLLTDDLGMQGYKQAQGKTKTGLFFTTDQITNYQNLITVDSISATTIK